MIDASPSTNSSATSVVMVVWFGFQLWNGLDRLRNPCLGVKSPILISEIQAFSDRKILDKANLRQILRVSTDRVEAEAV
jgi:hypothetical protein